MKILIVDDHAFIRDALRDDVLDGSITAEEARRDYGVVIDERGEIDLAATARIRSS
jgi:hypothetical protein